MEIGADRRNRRRLFSPMDMVKTDKLVFEYEKRDEEGNVIGMHLSLIHI